MLFVVPLCVMISPLSFPLYMFQLHHKIELDILLLEFIYFYISLTLTILPY